MPHPKFSQTKKDKIVELFKANVPMRKIARMLDCSYGGVRKLLSQHGLVSFMNPETTKKALALMQAGWTGREVAKELGLAENTVFQMTSVQHHAELLEPIKQDYLKVIEHRKMIARQFKGGGRYLVIGDAHVKFHSKELFDAVMSMDGSKFDGFIVAGDLIDNLWASTFRKESYVSIADELSSAKLIMTNLVKRFHRGIFFMGNHELRTVKNLLEAAEPLRALTKEAGGPGIALALDSIQDMYFGSFRGVVTHPGWFVEVGSVIIAHADLFSHSRAAVPKNIIEHFMSRKSDWDIDHEVSGVLQFHMHRQAGPMRVWGRTLLECPAACGPLSYQMSDKANRGQSDTGITVLEINKDGTINFNGTRSYLIDKENSLPDHLR